MYMRDILDCDLASGFFDPGSYSKSEILAQGKGKKEKWKGNFQLPTSNFQPKLIALTRSRIFTKGIRHIKLKLAFLRRTKFLADYDTVIFSGDCLAAVRNVRPDAKKIFYCHTPPRYIFDKREWYEKQLSKHYRFVYPLIRPIYRWVRDKFEQAYREDIAQMDIVVTNSKEVQARVKKYFGIDTQIIHPPVDIARFCSQWTMNNEQWITDPHNSQLTTHNLPSKGFYLFFGRLAEFKRVDVIIEAFRHMPDKRILITYGKNDPIKDKLIKQAKGLENVDFCTDVDDDEAVWLLGNAIATIYIPKDEDFGMVPIESMACGTPVIGVHEWGLKETVITGKTWLLIDPNDLLSDLQDAVKVLDARASRTMSEDCKKNAQRFSLEHFERQIWELGV